MSKGYVDKRREDRLSLRSITLRDEKLVKDLDAYCLLTDTKIVDYVVRAIRKQLNFDMDDLRVVLKQFEEIEGDDDLSTK